MVVSVVPFLMFEGNAEEAMNFYVSIVPNARILSVDYFREGEEGKEGSVKQAIFDLAGQKVRCFDSSLAHGFTFTPSISFFITCEETGEVDRLASALGHDGKVMMPAGEYGFSRRFTWVQDRFGVSWQIHCE